MNETANETARILNSAIALSLRGAGRTSPNPNVACIIMKHGRVIGRGWTQPGGRPHAEAAALEMAGDAAKGADVYVTLEPCAHESDRGPSCADILIAAKVNSVHIAALDPDPRTAGKGAERLEAAGIKVTSGTCEAAARSAMAGYFSRLELGRPRITLKLALSIDGRAAMADGESQWITGEAARAHAHMERARADLILVGRGTLEADDPSLTVRIEGLEARSPPPAVLSATLAEIPAGKKLGEREPVLLSSFEELAALEVNDILVEGGTGIAGALLEADLVDRLLIYRAPILIGDGAPGAGRVGLAKLADAHGRWLPEETQALGSDTLEVYVRQRDMQ